MLLNQGSGGTENYLKVQAVREILEASRLRFFLYSLSYREN